MIKLENTGNGYTLSGSKEELLSLTTQKLEEMFQLAEETEVKLLGVPNQTAIKPWLN